MRKRRRRMPAWMLAYVRDDDGVTVCVDTGKGPYTLRVTHAEFGDLLTAWPQQ